VKFAFLFVKVEHEKLVQEADELARRLKQDLCRQSESPRTCWSEKRTCDLESALTLEAAAQAGCMETADFKRRV